MSKRSLIFTSLVAAIPAGILLALIIMTLIGSSENMTTVLHIFNAILLIACTLIVLLPLGIALEVAGLGMTKGPATAPANVPLDEDDEDDDYEDSSPASAAADDDDEEEEFGFEDEDDDDGFDDFEDDDDDWE